MEGRFKKWWLIFTAFSFSMGLFNWIHFDSFLLAGAIFLLCLSILWAVFFIIDSMSLGWEK